MRGNFQKFAEVSGKVVETAMHASSWINWWKIFWNFIHHFGTLGETLSSVSRKFSGEFIKTAFLKYRGSIYWNRFLLGKIVSSLLCRLERHFFWFFCWRFCGGMVKTASYIFIGSSWGNTYLLDKLCSSIVFPDIEQNLFVHFSSEISKLAATWPEENFDEKNFELFFFHFWTLRESFSYNHRKISVRVVNTAISVSQGTVSGQIFLENFCFLCLFRSREINYRPFVQNGATWLSELHSKIHKNISRKTYSPEKVVFSIIFRLDWYSFETLLNFSVGVFKTAYYKFMKTFERKFFPWKNLLRNNFEIGVQTFQIFAGISSKVAETAIHVSV